jgi:hypothetical protein
VKVRAIAIATARTNVIGSVEVCSSPEGMRIIYLDAARLGSDGVPIAFDQGTDVLVPWERVRDARVVGHAVLLELEMGPSLVHRMMLVRFSFGNETSPHEIRQRRLLLRAFALAVGIMSVAVSAVVLPRHAPQLGPWFGVGLGVVLAAIISVAGIVADRWIVTGGQPSALVREIFIGELMATLPRLPREPAALVGLSPTFRWPTLDGLLPRTTLAVTITLAGALLAAMVMVKWVFWGNHTQPRDLPAKWQPASPTETPNDAITRHALAAPGPALPSATTAPIQSANPLAPSRSGLTVRGPCSCTRPDSPLWRESLPRLTPLVLATRRFPHKTHEDIELELAVVNNSDRPLGNVSVLVEFYEADQGNVTRLTSVESRTVFFEGPLGAGKAIKWHVEERGTTFKIHPPTSNGIVVDEAIGPLGEGAASATAFADLLHANHRPVRLHAAMMLAYLGDKRARPGVIELGEALRDSETGYLRRLLEATTDQYACQIELGPSGNPRTLRTCIFNAGSSPISGSTATLRLLDSVLSPKDPIAPPPQIVAERILPLEFSVPPKAGLQVEGAIDWNDLPPKPVSYELLVSVSPGK